MTIVVPNVPTPVPTRADPANFAERADAYHTALPGVVDAMNQQNAENNALNSSNSTLLAQTHAVKDSAVSETTALKDAAVSAKVAAEAAAANAASANGGQLWVSGATYAVNFLVYSPLTRRSYRRLIAGAGTVDPSIDTTNWGVLSVVLEQSDVGSGPNQVPLNSQLGKMAYVDELSSDIEAGAGITLGSGTICKCTFSNMDEFKSMKLIIDITGLKGGTAAGDLIGSDSTTINSTKQPCYIAQLPAGFTVLGGRMICLEAPAGGGTDIDLYSAVESAGVQDDAVTNLTETQLVNGGVQALGTTSFFLADPTISGYLYLVSQGTTTTAYTAGRFLIEIFGV